MKKLLLALMLSILMPASVSALTLNADVTVDWINGEAVNIKAEGGDSRLFICSDVTNSNYNSFDTVLEARVNRDGHRYYSDISVDWLNAHSFMVRTEERDWGFDCNEVNETNYNTFDDVLHFDFEAESDTNSLSDTDVEQIEAIMNAVIKKYINYSTNISECEKNLVELQGKSKQMEDKWKTCEQESGAIKEQIKNANRELASTKAELEATQNKRDSLEDEVKSKNEQLSNAQKACSDQMSQKEQEIQVLRKKISELEKKNSNTITAGLIGGLLLLIFRGKKGDGSVQPEVEEELDG